MSQYKEVFSNHEKESTMSPYLLIPGNNAGHLIVKRGIGNLHSLCLHQQTQEKSLRQLSLLRYIIYATTLIPDVRKSGCMTVIRSKELYFWLKVLQCL